MRFELSYGDGLPQKIFAPCFLRLLWCFISEEQNKNYNLRKEPSNVTRNQTSAKKSKPLTKSHLCWTSKANPNPRTALASKSRCLSYGPTAQDSLKKASSRSNSRRNSLTSNPPALGDMGDLDGCGCEEKDCGCVPGRGIGRMGWMCSFLLFCFVSWCFSVLL